MKITARPTPGAFRLNHRDDPQAVYGLPEELATDLEGGSITLEQVALIVQRMAEGHSPGNPPSPQLGQKSGICPVFIDRRNAPYYMETKDLIHAIKGEGRTLPEILGRQIMRVELGHMMGLQRAF